MFQHQHHITGFSPQVADIVNSFEYPLCVTLLPEVLSASKNIFMMYYGSGGLNVSTDTLANNQKQLEKDCARIIFYAGERLKVQPGQTYSQKLAELFGPDLFNRLANNFSQGPTYIIKDCIEEYLTYIVKVLDRMQQQQLITPGDLFGVSPVGEPQQEIYISADSKFLMDCACEYTLKLSFMDLPCVIPGIGTPLGGKVISTWEIVEAGYKLLYIKIFTHEQRSAQFFQKVLLGDPEFEWTHYFDAQQIRIARLDSAKVYSNAADAFKRAVELKLDQIESQRHSVVRRKTTVANFLPRHRRSSLELAEQETHLREISAEFETLAATALMASQSESSAAVATLPSYPALPRRVSAGPALVNKEVLIYYAMLKINYPLFVREITKVVALRNNPPQFALNLANMLLFNFENLLGLDRILEYDNLREQDSTQGKILFQVFSIIKRDADFYVHDLLKSLLSQHNFQKIYDKYKAIDRANFLLSLTQSFAPDMTEVVFNFFPGKKPLSPNLRSQYFSTMLAAPISCNNTGLHLILEYTADVFSKILAIVFYRQCPPDIYQQGSQKFTAALLTINENKIAGLQMLANTYPKQFLTWVYLYAPTCLARAFILYYYVHGGAETNLATFQHLSEKLPAVSPHTRNNGLYAILDSTNFQLFIPIYNTLKNYPYFKRDLNSALTYVNSDKNTAWNILAKKLPSFLQQVVTFCSQ